MSSTSANSQTTTTPSSNNQTSQQAEMVKEATALKATPQTKRPNLLKATNAGQSALANLDEKTLKAMLKQLQAEASKEGCRLFKPYSKQKDFITATHSHRETLFAAGNQLGKTYAAANALAIMLTGEYPEWWDGRRWDRPIAVWVGGVTNESTRDTMQRLLMGRPGSYGTGAIPADMIDGYTSARGVADALDTITVKNKFGGKSTLTFKSYLDGRAKWQGETLDVVAFDEEPPEDIYTEGLTRTNATGGLAWLTFTPLLGMSAVVSRFFEEESPDRALVSMTIYDVDHYTPEQRESTPATQAPTIRAKGPWIPVAWPHDGLQHDKGSGEQLAEQYRVAGVNMLHVRATHAPGPGQSEGQGGNGVEAGVMEMLERMQSGRWKVFDHLGDWFAEFRLYHRKDGKIVKLRDDVLSASRYAMMMRRFACVEPRPLDKGSVAHINFGARRGGY